MRVEKREEGEEEEEEEEYGGKVNQRPPRDAADSLIAVGEGKLIFQDSLIGTRIPRPRVSLWILKNRDAARVNTWNPVCRVCVRDAEHVITRKQRGQSGGNYF